MNVHDIIGLTVVVTTVLVFIVMVVNLVLIGLRSRLATAIPAIEFSVDEKANFDEAVVAFSVHGDDKKLRALLSAFLKQGKRGSISLPKGFRHENIVRVEGIFGKPVLVSPLES